jgi:hypothetical protein
MVTQEGSPILSNAELISKVILLAKDADIRDPTILEQILNWHLFQLVVS